MVWVEQKNSHINPDLIVRDEEVFHRRTGLGFYDPQLVEKLRKFGIQRGNRNIWLPSETLELASNAAGGKSVLVVCELGAGKSALMYGLRTLYREDGNPYAYVDGHFTMTPEPKVRSAMRWADRVQAELFWDSLDYIIGGSRKIRKMPRGEFPVRSHTIVHRLLEHMDQGNAVIGTSHSEKWVDTFGDPDLMSDGWKELLGSMEIHQVRGTFEAPEEFIQFYVSAGLSEEAASYMATLKTNPRLEDALDPHRYSPELHQVISAITDAIPRYRVAKLLALDPRDDSKLTRVALESLVSGTLSEDEFLKRLIEFIVAKNE